MTAFDEPEGLLFPFAFAVAFAFERLTALPTEEVESIISGSGALLLKGVCVLSHNRSFLFFGRVMIYCCFSSPTGMD